MPPQTKISLTLIVLLFFSQTILSQGLSKFNKDSLLHLLTTIQEADSKVKILNDLAYIEQFNEPQKGLNYANIALKISDSTHNLNGLAISNAMLGLNNATLGNLKEAIKFENEALKTYQKIRRSKRYSRNAQQFIDCIY